MLTGAEVGVTVTLGVTVGFFDGSGNRDCSFAADKPNTISSNFLLFFSFPINGSGSGCKGSYGRIIKIRAEYRVLTQFFLFINLERVSSSLFPAFIDVACNGTDFFTEKSCTSFCRSILDLSEDFGMLK